jgi:hypothetical protein
MSEQTILLVDCFAVAYQQAMTIGNGGEAISQVLEKGHRLYQKYLLLEEDIKEAERYLLKKEMAYRIRKSILGLSLMYKPTQIIFATDSKPYWRTEYLRDYWKEYGRVSADDSIYVFDNLYLPKGEDKRKALSVKELKEMDLGAMGFSYPNDEQLEFFPKYKGQRKPFLLEGITKEEFSELVAATYADLAEKLNGVHYGRKGLEADDIAGYFAKNKKESTKLVLASVDGDWKQLVRFPNVSFYDIRICTEVNGTSWQIEEEKLWAKILGGDSGDNISGCAKGHKGAIGKDSATKLVKENGIEWVKNEFSSDPQFKRNIDLVMLPSPLWNKLNYETIKEEVKKVWKNKTPDAKDSKTLATQWGIDSESCAALIEETDLNRALLKMRGD